MKMTSIPAILGGEPAFASKIPIVRPVLPPVSELSGGLEEIIHSGMVTKGKYLQAFEHAVQEHLGVKHAVGVSSCTTGLMLTYRSLNLSGDVVVPSFTFMATVSALVWAGLRPVYADVDAGTTNLNVASAEKAITPNTSAIVAVHNFGNPAQIEELEELARRHNLKLIFDAAHGFGALYRGDPVGKQGDAHVFSLSPTKLLIAGEGGIVATNHDDLAEKIRMGREYGNSGDYDSAFAGLNARLAEFNALMGLKSLQMLENAATTRNETVALYHEMLGMLPGIDFQQVHPDDRNSYKDFSITIDADAFGLTRDELSTALNAENIDNRKYYDPPVHRQTAYRGFADGSMSLENTEYLAANSLSLPIWTNMEHEVSAGICEAIRHIYRNAADIHKKLS
jgi:dTDP-4-amino-4,6-dideoxygalactose transaminase